MHVCLGEAGKAMGGGEGLLVPDELYFLTQHSCFDRKAARAGANGISTTPTGRSAAQGKRG